VLAMRARKSPRNNSTPARAEGAEMSMNTLWHSIDACTNSAAPRRTRRHYSRAGVVAFWLCAVALMYFGSRL
jgi:hypothetical protein